MENKDEKIIEKIEKLIALSSSSNENEARAAMLKAQELMAKYEIDRSRVQGDKEAERAVVGYTSPSFRDDWCQDIASVIAHNFRCRLVIMQKCGNCGGAYRLRFYGFDEDANICINIFNYAVKVVRKRLATLRAIYQDAERDFGRNEKRNYVDGFCQRLHVNFEEQRQQNNAFALVLVTPKEVNEFVDCIPGITEQQVRPYERDRTHDLLRRNGYIDGKAFRNAGDKERLDE